MATFFGYRGYIGCDAFTDEFRNDETEEERDLNINDLSTAIINDPFSEGQLGFVFKLLESKFNDEALKVLKTLRKGDSTFDDLTLFQGNEETGPIIGWLGGPMVLVDSNTQFDKDSDISLLDNIEPQELDIPQGLIEFIDATIDGTLEEPTIIAESSAEEELNATVSQESLKEMLDETMGYVTPAISIEEFQKFNEDELNCIFAESGSDREPDFDYDQQCEYLLTHPSEYPCLIREIK